MLDGFQQIEAGTVNRLIGNDVGTLPAAIVAVQDAIKIQTEDGLQCTFPFRGLHGIFAERGSSGRPAVVTAPRQPQRVHLMVYAPHRRAG